MKDLIQRLTKRYKLAAPTFQREGLTFVDLTANDQLRALLMELRDRLIKLQAEVYAMQANGLRVTTASLNRQSAGLAGLIVKLQGCELNHQIAGLAIDALGELGILYGEGDHLRSDGSWQWRYMYDLGLIIGGGTAQIQKNIISERGLGMPREPKPAKV